ncbi:MAG: PP2C family protein-serine/threonine phosphatase [Candidatus Gracilibacteria bacterium]|nr:PP2C family protein-serine/threonine phosphatase [Candidatus Gracilibacteria bacterium]
MFEFFKKKKRKINTQNIKTFSDVVKVIEDFIYFEEFDKANLSINEVIQKETKAFNNFIEKISENNRDKETKKFKNKINILNKLQEKNIIKKKKFDIDSFNRKKKEEMKYIGITINNLIGKKDFHKGIVILNSLLDSYNNDAEILDFINKKKKLINKEITKDKIKKEKEIRTNAFLEAQTLIGEIKREPENNVDKSDKLFKKIKSKFLFYTDIRKRLKEKKLLDEINLLLKIQSQENEIIVKSKLSQVHSGFAREISGERINGYEMFGKILGADKITGDSLGFVKNKDKYTFYIGDATGHGIRAGFIISQLTKKFYELSGKLSLQDLVVEINNSLKQDLKSGNFVTSIFFTLNKTNPNKLSFIGMGHEPLFIYRKSTSSVEKHIPGGLATGIRLIKDKTSIKTKEINLEDGDMVLSYTDGIVEARNDKGEMYGIERIGKKFEEFAKNENNTINDIYINIIEDLKIYVGLKANYLDDVSILIFKRDKTKEVQEEDNIVDEIIKKEGIDKKYKKNIKGKDLVEIKEEIKKIQKENALKNILKYLDNLHKTGELPKLKQDCIRYIRQGYIHSKINKYLKETLENENSFKIAQKEQKIRDKYNILLELYKKGDYETVISECNSVLSKDGNL